MKNNFDHFKNEVSQSTKEKILAFAEKVENDFDELFDSSELYDVPRLSDISGKAFSGFWPHQDGGYKIDSLCRCDQDSSYHETEKQTAFMNEQGKACLKRFLDEKGIDCPEDESGLYDAIPEDSKEELYDYENEWLEPALCDLRIFIDGGTVTIDKAINYRDAPYYREGKAEVIKSVDLSETAFLNTCNAALFEMMKEA